MKCSTWMLAATLLYPFQSLMAEPPTGSKLNALDAYIAAPDASYAWSLESTVDGIGMKTHVIRLTSQTWRSSDEVDRPLWQHWLTVTVPDQVKTDRVFLFIGGGSHKSEMPKGPDAITAEIARSTQGVVAELKNIPNQPLVFHNDGQPRSEDDLIGYAWSQYLESGDPLWLPRLPMVKSVVRAMDCITEFSASEMGGKRRVEKFVVGGGSKRGWTTWIAGAADQRVEAIVPIVIDVANVHPSLRNHAEVYGFWSEAIGNYYQHRILQRFDHPRLKEVYELVDPYAYRDRLQLPKYILNASGDQFFTPDSSKFYYDSLLGEKLLRYVPNADHGLKDTDAVQSLAAFFAMVSSGKRSPEYDWQFAEDGTIVVDAKSKPMDVRVWWANNPTARDFRLKTIGSAFQSEELLPNATGKYVAPAAPKQPGWTASFVELSFDVGAAFPLKVTTAVRITPDVLPYQGVDLTQVEYEPLKKKQDAATGK